MNLDYIDMLEEYKAENDELLQNMEDSLMDIQENGMDDENINAVFRAAHTIKGSSGMFGIDYIVEFTHIAENLLDKIRNHKIEINDEIIEILLACKDQMQQLVDFVVSNPEADLDEDSSLVSKNLIEELEVILNVKPTKEIQEIQTPIVSEKGLLKQYKISIDFGSDTFSHGFDTYTFLNYLYEMGEIKNLYTNTDVIPLFTDIDSLECYMSYTIELESDEDISVIESAFEFVKESSNITIVDVLDDVEEIENEEIQTEEEQPQETQVQAKQPQAVLKQKKNSNSTSKPANLIRIEASKVDSLINLIGEMVISNASVMQHASSLKHLELIESVSTVSRMLEEVRENAMQIRMVAIGETFNKFKRIVHDTAKKIGKKVDLQINGGDTELDKTVIEKISDPLVHLIRNSVDHGIENPKVREELNKSSTGVLQLNAYHDTDSIAIEIIDDGNGLDEEVLLAKGIEKGLVKEGDKLSQKEIFELILQPGFSTAKEVSDISGRGVGMDVVKRNISELRGSIDIDSKKSEGTKITIRLPLTLAIIDGFLIKVGDTNIIIPLDMLVECIELSSKAKEQMNNNSYINLRGRVLPLLNIADYFNITQGNSSRSNIVVINYAGQKMGIIVDELLGELQTVIKPMGKLFQNLKYFSGSTILGSGEVALIMDIPVMLQMMEYKQKELVA